jgi:hypothetical protein
LPPQFPLQQQEQEKQEQQQQQQPQQQQPQHLPEPATVGMASTGARFGTSDWDCPPPVLDVDLLDSVFGGVLSGGGKYMVRKIKTKMVLDLVGFPLFLPPKPATQRNRNQRNAKAKRIKSNRLASFIHFACLCLFLYN